MGADVWDNICGAHTEYILSTVSDKHGAHARSPYVNAVIQADASLQSASGE